MSKPFMTPVGDGTPTGATRYRVTRALFAMIDRARVGAVFYPPESDGGGALRVTRIDRKAREVDLMEPEAFERYFGR